MNVPITNLRIIGDRTYTLRAISIVTFPPALLFLLIHGPLSHSAFPALTLIPALASTVFSAFLVHQEQTCQVQAHQLRKIPAVVLADVLLATLYTIFLIISWVSLTKHHSWRYGGNSAIILGTYGTIPLMINWLSHTYLGLEGLWRLFGSSLQTQLFAGPISCPHCASGAHGHGHGDVKKPLLEDDGEGHIELGGAVSNRSSLEGDDRV